MRSIPPTFGGRARPIRVMMKVEATPDPLVSGFPSPIVVDRVGADLRVRPREHTPVLPYESVSDDEPPGGEGT